MARLTAILSGERQGRPIDWFDSRTEAPRVGLPFFKSRFAQSSLPSSVGRTEGPWLSDSRTSVERSGVGNASNRIHLGVSDLSAFRTSACARGSRFPQRAKPGKGHLGAHLRPLCYRSGRTIWATIKRWRPSGKTAKLPHGQRDYRRAA